MRTRISIPTTAAEAASASPENHPQDPLRAIVDPAHDARGMRRWPRSRTRAVGSGTAWLVFDAGGDLFRYQCYWFGGRCGDHLLEHTRAVAAADAVEWARARTPRARIRLSDHRTYWAGTGPDPGGFAGTWLPHRSEHRPIVVPPPSEQLEYEDFEPSEARIRDTVGAGT